MNRRVASLFVLLAAACSPAYTLRPEVIVLVSVDTLRADRLGVYGYPRATSPFLDEMAERGVVFDRVYAVSATTAPAHASLFTGVPPLIHGVRSNHQRLRPDLPTLAERFRVAGYETAAFVAVNTHFSQSGLDRGFTHFDRPQGHGGVAVRSAVETAAAASRWLASRAEGPLFLWVHFFDPHTPWDAPAFESPAGVADHARYLTRDRGTPLDFFAGDPENLMALTDAYDGQLLVVDAGLRALYTALGPTSASRPTLWIVTSDHGEGLGNHHWLMHGAQLYDEQLRIPFIVFDSAGELEPARFEDLVSQIDVVPTLVDLAALRWPESVAPPQGSSLAPLLRGDRRPPRRAIFSERRAFSSAAVHPGGPPRPTVPEPFSLDALIREAHRVAADPGEKFSLRDDRYKLIFHSVYGDELYDLVADPLEFENLVGRGHPAEASLRAALDERLADLREHAAEPTPIDRDSVRALRALGYLE